VGDPQIQVASFTFNNRIVCRFLISW